MGLYLSERQWDTVREDYSDNGGAWNFLCARASIGLMILFARIGNSSVFNRRRLRFQI